MELRRPRSQTIQIILNVQFCLRPCCLQKGSWKPRSCMGARGCFSNASVSIQDTLPPLRFAPPEPARQGVKQESGWWVLMEIEPLKIYYLQLSENISQYMFLAWWLNFSTWRLNMSILLGLAGGAVSAKIVASSASAWRYMNLKLNCWIKCKHDAPIVLAKTSYQSWPETLNQVPERLAQRTRLAPFPWTCSSKLGMQHRIAEGLPRFFGKWFTVKSNDQIGGCLIHSKTNNPSSQESNWVWFQGRRAFGLIDAQSFSIRFNININMSSEFCKCRSQGCKGPEAPLYSRLKTPEAMPSCSTYFGCPWRLHSL